MSASDYHIRNSQPLIQTENLTLQYGQKTAFADVTLDVNQGEILALVGPSGCGKTSFLSCLNRLTDMIPQCRVRGRIQMGTLEVLDAKTNAIALPAPQSWHDIPKAQSFSFIYLEEPGITPARTWYPQPRTN